MHLEKLKKEIEQLSDEEFGQLRRWFAEKDLVRSHVPYPDLETAYKEMAQDEERKTEALEWPEATTRDTADETE